MSADNGLIYVENIRKALVDIDPNNADTYNRNARDYSARISQLSLLVKQGFSSLPDEKDGWSLVKVHLAT